MRQKRTILFLVRLYHPHIGGVEKHVRETIAALGRRGYSVTIVTERFNSNLPLRENYQGTEIIRIPIGKSAFYKKFFVWQWVITNLPLFLKADIIHIHDVFYWILPVRLLLFSKKIYITFHGYEGYPVKMKWRFLRKIAERSVFGNLCIGDFMKKWYSTNPTAISYGGVEQNSNITAPPPQTAVFFGRLDDQTGILEYVEAYTILKKKFPHFRLTVVGNGYLQSRIPKSVSVLPFDSSIEKYIIQNRFIFVSRYLSMLEGLVQKREVIAVYDNPVKRDYLLQSPFARYVFVAKNAQEIASTVEKCLSSKHFASEKIEKGYAWANKQTWDRVAGCYLRLWKEK